MIVEVSYEKDLKNFQFIGEGLKAFNRNMVPELNNSTPCQFVLKEGGKTLGGLTAYTMLNSLMIDWLWVNEDYQGQGHGSNLLEHAENFALTKGCSLVLLNTLSPQAVDFYLHHGYAVKYRVNLQNGHRITYMEKKIG